MEYRIDYAPKCISLQTTILDYQHCRSPSVLIFVYHSGEESVL